MPKQSDEPPPEGPEVKRCSEVLSGMIGGKILSEVKLISGKLSRIAQPAIDKLKLPAKVEKVSVKGKVIFIKLEGDYSIISTLGMSGWWYPQLSSIDPTMMDQAYYSKIIDTISKAEKHTRLTLVMSDGSIANYIDPRNFGNIYIVDQHGYDLQQSSLGIDLLNQESYLPVESQINSFYELSHARKYSSMKIGDALLDQTLLAGLGNIYRAETLYLAGISPHRIIKTLSEEECKLMVSAAAMVLEIAYVGRGMMIYPLSNVMYYLTNTMRYIRFEEKLQRVIPANTKAIYGHLVYGCNVDIMGYEVMQEKIGGRTAWWVPEVQT